MPLFIKHRVNLIADLDAVKPEWGVEIDLRSDVNNAGKIHLSHDAWKRGDDFQAWLAAFQAKDIRGPLIVNTKEDGLEETVMEALRRAGVDNYFFLDSTVPTLVRLTAGGSSKKFAVRLSAFEGVDGVRRFEGRAEWVWVDCFGGIPLPESAVKPLKNAFKICLVSPELQGHPLEAITKFQDLGLLSDAICTKRPDVWRK